MEDISTVKLDTDILIIGGGAAGCMAAILDLSPAQDT